MDASETNYPPGDPRLIDKIVYQLKSQGIFDQFRKECMADVDTKPAYQNLHQRVEASVSTFLAGIEWKPDLSKNQLRENLRKHINESGFLEIGVERIVDQVVNPKIRTVFLPHVEEVVYSFLGLERPKQAKPSANTTMLKPMNEPPPYAEIKPPEPPEPKQVVTVPNLLPQGLNPVFPEIDTCELALKKDDAMEVEFSDGETIFKDKKAEEDTSPAFEPLLDENSNGSHVSVMSGFSSHDEGQPSPARQGFPRTAGTSDGEPRLDGAEKMEVETSCKSESESGADKVSSTVEESVQSPAQMLTHDMSTLDIQESTQSGERLPGSSDPKDEKCDSSMDSVRNESKDKDSDKEKESRRKEKHDSKSSKSRSDSKDKYKSSDKSRHDSRDKKQEKEKSRHEDNKSGSKSETRKDKDSGSRKEKVSDGKKDKGSDVKKDKKVESSKSDHKDGGSKKDKDAGNRREREHESSKDKDGDRKHHDKDGDKKKHSDRDKSRSEDRSKSKHDEKTKDRKSETKHGKEGRDKGQANKDDKPVKSSEKKGKGTSNDKVKTGERDKEKSSTSTYKHSSDQKSSDDSEKKEKDRKAKTPADRAMHVDDRHLADAENSQKSKTKSNQGRTRTKTPDDVQSTDGDSDARSRDSYKKTSKDGAGRRIDDQASTDNESDHKSRDSDKSMRNSKHKHSSRRHGSEERAEDDDGEGSSKDGERKRKERRHKGAQDDHHMHHSRRDHDRRSADRDSSGSAPQSGGGQAQRQGRSRRQESSSSSSPRKSGKTSDTSSSATDAPESLHLDIKDSSVVDNPDSEASPTSTLPFKKRPLLQDMESEDNANNNSYLHDKTAFLESDEPDTKAVDVEDVDSTSVPKEVEKMKLGAVENSLRSEVNASLIDGVPSSDGKPNGMLGVGMDEEENDFLYFKSCDDSFLDDRDIQYVKALAELKDSDGVFTTSGDEELTVCAVSQRYVGIVNSASKLGLTVVKTLNDIIVYSIEDEHQQELGSSFKDLLKNRRYVVRLSDGMKVFKENINQGKTDSDSNQTLSEESHSAEENTSPEHASANDSPEEPAADRSASDEDVIGYDAALSNELILPSLQDLMRESGMVPSPNTTGQMGSCRRVGLPRPATRRSSGGSSGGACVDKKNGMSSDRRLLRSSVGESQRYSSEDLYKPRPLFSHGSRRNRHTSEEQASRPVAVAVARPSSRNITRGVGREPQLSRCDLLGLDGPRAASVSPCGKHQDGPEASVVSATSPLVAASTTSPPPVTFLLSLPRVHFRLLACHHASRHGRTRAVR